jgi:hypothetical protein
MSSVRRRRLQIDDPLGPGEPTQPDTGAAEAGMTTTSGEITRQPTEGSDRTSEDGQRGEPQSGRQDQTGTSQRTAAPVPQPASREVWRAWSGITGVGSFRLPHELLVELSDTAREHGLPIGMIVTAAITQLLDEPPAQIAALVDRADDARIHGRRSARRRLSERADG